MVVNTCQDGMVLMWRFLAPRARDFLDFVKPMPRSDRRQGTLPFEYFKCCCQRLPVFANIRRHSNECHA